MVVGGEETRRVQWERITFAFCKRGGCPEQLAEMDGKWADMIAFVNGLRGRPRQDVLGIRRWSVQVREEIEDRKKILTADRRLAWRAWVREQIRRGGGALHAFTKRVVEQPEGTLQVEGERSGSPQTHVEADRIEWDKTWQRLKGIATAPWREETGQLEEWAVLPPPATVQELRMAASRFSHYTGVGADSFRPHWFSWLSTPLLATIGQFMMNIEAAGRWPGQVLQVLVHLIPKEGGGRRPIGLLASLVRWWERLRAPLIQQWRLRHARPFNWAAPGKNAEKAVWEQSLLDEAAANRGWSSASTLIDLVKAFEHIPLAVLWKKARAHSFPLRLMCLVLELCAAPRRLVFREAVSEATSTLTAVIAGLVSAIDCMYLMVVDSLDELRREFPLLRIVAYVDDITLHRTGLAEEVRVDIEASTSKLVKNLEEACSLVVSRTKSAVVVSGKGLGRRIRKGMAKMGIPVGLKARLLGVDYHPGGGKGPKREVQGRRWAKVKNRRGRIVKLGRRGGPHVVATGVAPAARYGASVTGPSCALVRELGTITAEAFGRMGGRSVWARLGVRGADHRIGLVLRPVRAWVEAVWEGRLDREDMEEAWKLAQRVTGLSARPHRTANGAARSYIAALSRLGWSSPAVDAVLTREGHLLRIGQMDVVSVMRHAEDDLMVMMAAESAVGRDMNDPLGERGHYRAIAGALEGAVNVGGEEVKAHVAGSTMLEERLARVWRGPRYQQHQGRLIPWLLPATMLLRRRLGNTGNRTAADASVAAMVEGGWWTAARLAAAGLRRSAICAACGRAIGTLWHRLGECPATEAEREGKGGCPAWLLKKGRTSVWDPLFARGLPALPKVPPPPPERVVRTVTDGEEEEGEAATGDIYTDGAVRGRWRRIMRAGWGVVALKEGQLKVTWRMHGTCPDVHPSVLRAELTAVLNVLRIALPPLRIHVDNAEVVSGFRLGEEWCVAPGRDGADLWREVWARMDDMDGQVEVIKVKAHTEEGEVEEGIITARDRYGNLHADAEAKRGAKLAETLSPVGIARAELLKALRWLGWARRFAAVWKPDGREEEEDTSGAVEAGGCGPSAPRKGAGLRHLVWTKGPLLRCRRCGRLADTDQKRRDLRSSKCLGSAAGRLLSRTCNDPEAVSRSCMERREDLARRGWRALAGGGDEVGADQAGRAVNFEEEAEGGLDSEEEEPLVAGGREAGGGVGDGEDGLDADGMGAEAGRAVAAASGSGSASAAEGAGSSDAILVGGSMFDEPAFCEGPPAGSEPLRDWPELPAAEARLVLAEWDARGRKRRGGGASDLEGPPALGAPLSSVVAETVHEDLNDWPELPASEAREVLAQWRSCHIDSAGGESAWRKRRRAEIPLAPAGPIASVETATPPAADYFGPEAQSDDDPFGHVAADLAAQPPLRRGRMQAPPKAGSQRVSGGGERAGDGQDDPVHHPLGQFGRQELQGGASSTRKRSRMDRRPEEAVGQANKRRRGGELRAPSAAAGGAQSGGQEDAASHSARRTAFGRRYLGLVGDPVDAADDKGHQLRMTGPIIWCQRCGRYASRRLGKALKLECGGAATGAYATRVTRLREGRHPITGDFLV